MCRYRSALRTAIRQYERMEDTYLPMSFEIETARLSLRLMAPVDGPLLLELEGEHEGGTAKTLAEVQTLIAEQNLKSRSNGLGFLTIERRIERDTIGYCGLLVGRATFSEPEIAYEILPRVHRQGYATEAARAVLDAA
jgi:RimJ/RimL family protein N-acetyltransferase